MLLFLSCSKGKCSFRSGYYFTSSTNSHRTRVRGVNYTQLRIRAMVREAKRSCHDPHLSTMQTERPCEAIPQDWRRNGTGIAFPVSISVRTLRSSLLSLPQARQSIRGSPESQSTLRNETVKLTDSNLRHRMEPGALDTGFRLGIIVNPFHISSRPFKESGRIRGVLQRGC
jgi:hypothetical protein